MANRKPVMGEALPFHPAAVLIVDEDREFCVQTGKALLSYGHAVCAAYTGLSGLECVLTQPWQAVILNAELADLHGPGWLRRIRQVSNVPVLLISAKPRGADEVEALEAGADAYLSKDSSSGQLLAHLHAITRRVAFNVPLQSEATVLSEEIVVANLRIAPSDHRAILNDRELALTPSEFAILLSLAKAKGHVKTRDHLYAELRFRAYGAFDRSLDVLVCGLRKKLGDPPKRPRFIRTVRSAGYMFIDPFVS